MPRGRKPKVVTLSGFWRTYGEFVIYFDGTEPPDPSPLEPHPSDPLSCSTAIESRPSP